MPTPTRSITDETRAVSALKPDPKNARRHSEQQIAQIADAIEEYGYVHKIAVRPDGTIIGGHATLEALKRLNHTQVEVRVVTGLTPSQYRKLGLALNKLPENSSWDESILAEVIGELRETGDALDNIGFSERELDSLLAGDDAIEVKEIETSTVADEFWISIRGPLKHQAAALKALEAAMKPFADVDVELSTIAFEEV